MLRGSDTLTTAALAGDRDALRDLLRRHDPHLRAHFTGKIRATHRAAFDVDDVLQVTYLEVYLRIGQFRPGRPGGFRAWLTRIAENNLLDAVRGLGRQKRPPRERQVVLPSREESCASLFSMLSGDATTPSMHMARKEAKAKLECALDKLPPDYETVVRLCDLEKLPVGDVAKAMERSPASVYMLRARAHARLAEFLGSFSQC